MIVLFFLNLSAYVFLSLYQVYYMSSRFNLGAINPFTIAFAVSFPVLFLQIFGGPVFLLDDAFRNEYYIYALFVTNLELFFTLALVMVSFQLCRRSSFLSNLDRFFIARRPIGRSRLIFIQALSLGLFFVCFLLLSQDYGLWNWLREPRTGYQLYRVGNGHWYALSLLFLSVSFALDSLVRRRSTSIYFSTLFHIVLVYLLGSKGFVLSFAIFFLIVMWFRRSRYIRIYATVVPLFAFGLMLQNFGAQDFEAILRYFDYFVNSAMYFEAYFSGEIDLFLGKIWVTDFYKYIPRAIYQDKPFVYGFLHVNEFFFPGEAEKTNTPAFGGPVGLFADFGVAGVIFGSIFNLKVFFEVVFYHILYRNFGVSEVYKNANVLYLFLWLFAPSFLVFFGGIYSVLIFSFFIFSVSIIGRVRL